MTSTHESSPEEAARAANVGSTPIVRRSRTAHCNCAPPPLQEEMKTTLANETKGRYVGPVHPSQFLDDYLPRPNSTPTPLSKEELETLKTASEAKSEPEMYKSFKEVLERFAEGMKFVDTSSHPATDASDFGLKPDFCLYENVGEVPKAADFSAAELCIELKPSVSYDPFKDFDLKKSKGGSNDPFETDTVIANKTRGQITSYAIRQFNYQHRFFAFSVVVFGNHARLLRWDRGGAVVSTRFDYVKNSNLLVDFLWRFSHLPRVDRGHDPTVSPAALLSDEEAQTAREVLNLKAGTALFEFKVPHKHGYKSFYGPHFPYPVRSLIGRSTRTVPVCHLVGKKPGKKAFLKEYWRPAGVRGEVEVYEHLKKCDVPHIAPLWCGGDVPHGGTRTHERIKPKDSSPVMHLCLHRLVLDFVGCRLTEFKCTKELARAVLHAMTAHWQAYKRARILHRDVSVDNIRIDEDGNGVMIDWELAIFLDDESDNNLSRRHDRTGTWQFISAALLMKPGHLHVLQDDIESFVHVLGWTALSYLPSPMGLNERTHLVSSLYDDSFMNETGQEQGGGTKAVYFKSGDYPPEVFTLTEPSPILGLIRNLASPFQARYGEPPSEKDKKAFEALDNLVLKGHLDEEVLHTHPVYRHKLGMGRLSSSEWFLSIIQDALKCPDWPVEDGGADRLVAIIGGTTRQRQLAAKRIRTESQLLSASSGPLKRSNTSPPPTPQDKRTRLDDNSDGGITRG
ncbi:hypothetical protein F5141DRAFT_1213058 [Pisolithus sp. B1]|nr:hypothetical protein F5141DRAFT_1213058 [Pisolithus sp. B1]